MQYIEEEVTLMIQARYLYAPQGTFGKFTEVGIYLALHQLVYVNRL